ncbi:MAG: succinate-semialdehyde dehydrogenase, partial [Acidobacteria bacterium]
MSLRSVDPATGKVVREYEEASDQEVARAMDRAQAAFADWRRASFEERGRVVARAGALLRERAEPLAQLMAAEMGKPLPQGRAEAEKCAWVCDHYVANAARDLAPEEV